MSGAVLLFCFCFSLPVPAAGAESWIGEDKAKHFFASFFATSISASGARTLGLDPRRSAVAGAGFGSALGVWKEVRDRATPGHAASARDLVWDLAGVAAAALVMDQAR